MSIIMGALGGLGEAGSEVAQTYINKNVQSQLQQERAALEEQTQRNLASFKAQLETDTANKARTDYAARIGAAQDGILGQQINPQFDAAKKAYADADLPDEQKQGAYAEIEKNRSAALDAARAKNPIDLYIQAGIKTGDLDMKTAAALQKADEGNLTKMLLSDQKWQTLAMMKADDRNTRYLIAAMHEANKKSGKSTDDKLERLAIQGFIGDLRKQADTTESDIKSLRSARTNTFDKKRIAEIDSEIESKQADLKNLFSAQAQFSQQLGVKVPDVLLNRPAKAAPAPATPAAAPAAKAPTTAKRPPLSSFLRN